MQQKYSSYIDVNPLFESVVDIDADKRSVYVLGNDNFEIRRC